MFKALIFDMDGVLIDSEPLHKQIEQEILKELGVNLPLEEHFKFASMGKEMWDILEKRFGYNRKTTADELHKEKAARYIKALTSKPILPIKGLRELVCSAKEKGIVLAVASSSSVYNINLVLKAIGLERFFSLIVSGEQVPRNKPYPDIYLRTAELLHLSPEECMVVEDSANGVNAAKNAGMYCFGFHNPSSGNQDISPSDRIVNALDEIIEFI
ncbi:MAG: HAD family phosphatase [Bacteroidota bacterium]|nr:HAD family phosphatase [Bacteroidota bacterium]